MAGKRVCIICNGRYDYCPNCSEEQPRWKFLFDEQNCNNIWEVFNAYRTGQMDATQANKELQQLDLSKEADFNDTWKNLLEVIRKEAKPEPKVEKPMEKVEPKNEPQKKFNKDFKKR